MNVNAVNILTNMLIHDDDYHQVELTTDELMYLKFKCYDLDTKLDTATLLDFVEIILHEAIINKGYIQQSFNTDGYVWVLPSR